MNKKFVSFNSSLSKIYSDDDAIKLTMEFTEDEINLITKAFTKSKKVGVTNKYLIEQFIKECLMENIDAKINL